MKSFFRISNNKRLKTDIFLIIAIISIPFLFYLYNVAPNNTKIWVTKWFTLKSNYHEDVEYFIWLVLIKVLTISVLSLWYVSCTYNWRNFLLIPIILEFYKLLVNINIEIFNIDSVWQPFLFGIIISIPYIFFLRLISKRINYYKPNKTINEKLNTEINNQIEKLSKFKTKDYLVIKKEMQALLENKDSMPKKEYLAKLIALRDQLSID